jgi:Uma2 family endonuclease
MTRASLTTPSESGAPARTRRFTAHEVQRMVDCGVLGEDEHVELIDGTLVVREPQGPWHASTLHALAHRLQALVEPAGAHVRAQVPLAIGPDSLPEPDLAVVRGRALDYRARHPTGADALLVIELAVTSQAADRMKVEGYARGGVPACWLVDLAAGHLVAHARPVVADARYAEACMLGPDDAIPLPVPGTTASLAVRELLGR